MASADIVTSDMSINKFYYGNAISKYCLMGFYDIQLKLSFSGGDINKIEF